MKKKLSLLLALTLCLGLLGACGTPAEDPPAENDAEQTAATDLIPVVFTEQVRGYHWAPAYLAETLGYFEEEGIDASFETVSGMDATDRKSVV